MARRVSPKKNGGRISKAKTTRPSRGGRGRLDLIHLPPNDYLEGLGAFVLAFAVAETAAKWALYSAAQIGIETGNAVLSGVSVNNVGGLIIRALDVKDIQGNIRDKVEEALKHLSLINGVRNSILHHGIQPDLRGGWSVSNTNSAHVLSRRKEFQISVKDLNLMTVDLDKIVAHLNAFFWSMYYPESTARVDMTGRALRRAWLYKQTPQSTGARKTRSHPPKS